MKRFFFAAAAVALVASVGSAAEQPVTPVTPVQPAPIITTATPTPAVEYAPAQPQRRGLLARLRNRNNSTYNYNTAPQMVVPATPAAPVPMPGLAPQPMPTVKPTSGMVIPATGNLPPGQYTTTDGTIIQIGGPVTGMPMIGTAGGPVMTAGYTEPTTTTSARRGLFSRLRR
jgi:hypothetical protein